MEATNLVRGAVHISVTQIIQYSVYGIFYAIVARTGALTQKDIGTLSILSFLASTSTLIASLALPAAMTKFMAENIEKNKPEAAAAVQRTVITSVLILSTIGFAIITIYSGKLSHYFWSTSTYAPMIILMAIYGWLSSLTAVYKSSLQALGLFGKIAALTLLHVVLSRVAASFFALRGLGVSGVFTGFAIGYVLALTCAISFTRGKLPRSNSFAPIKPLISFSLPLVVGSVISLVIGWADIMIIASMTSNYELVGIYYIVLNSIGILSIIWNPIAYTLYPFLSAQHGLQDFETISNAIKISSRYISYLVLPSCLGLAIVAPTALRTFYGESYASGAIFLSILSIVPIMLAISTVLTATLTAIGKTVYVLRIGIIAAISDIALLLLFVSWFDAMGAAFARSIVQIMNILLVVYALRKIVKIRLDREAFRKSMTGSIATIPYLVLMEHFMKTIPTPLLLAIEIVGAGCIYLFFLYILKAFYKHDFELFRQVFPRLARYITMSEKILLRRH